MRTLMKSIGLLAGLILVLLLGLNIWLKDKASFKASGSMNIPGINQEVTVWRDKWGVAHISAQNKEDLWFAQGFITAQHRLFQMEFHRRVIQGKLAEVIGEDGLASDRYMRTLRLAQLAKEYAGRLTPETRAFIQQYVNGVNAYKKLLGPSEKPIELDLTKAEGKPWLVEDALSVVYLISLAHSRNYKTELLASQVNAALGQKNRNLFPLNINADRKEPVQSTDLALSQLENNPKINHLVELPKTIPTLGSNNWVISGEKSTTGRPILVNDPHVDVRILPGLWHPISFSTPDYKGAGMALPGIPGLFSGRSGSVGFGVTNAYGDVQDLYIETIKPNDPDKYLSSEGWKAFETIKEKIKVKDKSSESGFREELLSIRLTERGPIISDFINNLSEREAITENTLNKLENNKKTPAISLRWVTIEIQSSTLGLDQMMSAKNCAELEKAIAAIDLMQFNWAFADKFGCIGRRSSGAVPIRDKGYGALPITIGDTASIGAWKSYIPKPAMPGEINPKRGWTGTSNHDVIPDNYPYYYSNYFAPSYRYRRVKQLMESHEKVSPEQQWEFMTDIKNVHAERIMPSLLSALEGNIQFSNEYNLLSNWDFFEPEESREALLFHSLFHHLVKLTFEDDFDPKLLQDFMNEHYFWLERFEQLIKQENAPIFDIKTTDKVETLRDLVPLAMDKSVTELDSYFKGNWSSAQWGDVHTLTFVSPLRQKGFGSKWLGAGTWPQGGSFETLKRALYRQEGETLKERYNTEFFDSTRVVVDFSNDDSVQAIVAGGVVSRQFHKHYKHLVEIWQEGEYINLWMDPVIAKENSVTEMKLTPKN